MPIYTRASDITSDDVAAIIGRATQWTKDIEWVNEPCVRSLVINGPCVTVTLIDGRAFMGKFSEVLP